MHLRRGSSTSMRTYRSLVVQPPDKALQLKPASVSATTCGIDSAEGAAVPALTVSAFWCS